jgi:hypothetical protein
MAQVKIGTDSRVKKRPEKRKEKYNFPKNK